MMERDNKHHHSNKTSIGYAKWTAVAIFMGFQVLFLWKYLDKATVHSKPPAGGGLSKSTYNGIATTHAAGSSAAPEPVAAISETTTKTTTTTIETTTTTPVLLTPVETSTSTSTSSSSVSLSPMSGLGIQPISCALREGVYCEIFESIKNIQQLHMLEIGFGCDESNNSMHGSDILQQHSPGSSAVAWTNYFTDLQYYSLDHNPLVAAAAQQIHRKGVTTQVNICFANFTKHNPDTKIEHLWIGDQSNSSFLIQMVSDYQVLSQRPKWDIIIDNGRSHLYSGTQKRKKQQVTSMQELWPFVAEGGYYAVEGLQYDTDRLFARLSARWARLIAGGDFKRQDHHPNADEADWIVSSPAAIESLPPNISSISCTVRMCYMRKAFSNESPRPNHADGLNFL